MKYICLDCDKEIDELDIISNDENEDICPFCTHNNLIPKDF